MSISIRLSADLQHDSIVDGDGLRTVIWTQGCKHHCPGCHNPQTHNFAGGILVNIENILNQIYENPQNITFSGGDPFEQPLPCSIIAENAKRIGLDVWCYTGYTFEELLSKSENDLNIKRFLKAIDVIVDGKYIEALRDLSLRFRGSSNQRIIDVQKSLEKSSIVFINKDLKENYNQHGDDFI